MDDKIKNGQIPEPVVSREPLERRLPSSIPPQVREQLTSPNALRGLLQINILPEHWAIIRKALGKLIEEESGPTIHYLEQQIQRHAAILRTQRQQDELARRGAQQVQRELSGTDEKRINRIVQAAETSTTVPVKRTRNRRKTEFK